jgi:GNAT superfamily N-acetyltransferase
MQMTICEVAEHTEAYYSLMATAEQLDQVRYVLAQKNHCQSVLFGAFMEAHCVGFLRLVLQTLGQEEQRPPIFDRGAQPLREGYVEAFGVLLSFRRRGIGQALQEYAIAYCRDHHCYQIRSRSPVTSRENYALKLKMGYAIHPSHENDSYYFIKTFQST